MKTEKDGMPLNIQTHLSTGRGLALPIANRDAKNRLYTIYKKEVESRKHEFIFTEELKNIISLTGDYLTTEKNFYGLFMPGNVGNGKTTMLRAIKKLIVSLVDKGELNTCEGDKYPRYIKARDMAQMAASNRNEYDKLKRTKYLLLDDLGTEPTEVTVYGMPYKPFEELIDYRYEAMLPTFISSNLGAGDICQKYSDPRISDRMKEMFTIISYEGGSFR